MPVYQNSVINHRAHCLRVNESVPVSVVIMEVLATKQEYNILSVAQKLCKEQRKYRHRSKESTGFKLKSGNTLPIVYVKIGELAGSELTTVVMV